jgi:exosortase F-associated protein
MQKNKSTIALASILVILLVVIRIFESTLFYDPFLRYFKNDFTTQPLPPIDSVILFLNLFLRYFLNSLISIGLLYVLFKNKEILKLTAFLYILFFFILIIGFYIILYYFPENKMVLFYIRRFIIQPIFVLLFIPAFFYQEKVK